MILTYHKVFPEQKSTWWVTVDEFYQHMQALTAKKVVPLDQYDAADPRHVVITFDGVYDNIHRFATPILEEFGYPFELFVIGDHIGRDNGFDQHVEPPCMFASMEQLFDMAQRGGRIQWHTRSHARLNEVDETAAERELSVPDELAAMFPSPHLKWFAYPHGVPNEKLRTLVSQRFAGALACDDGNPQDIFFFPRRLIHPGASLYGGTVAAIVANYNYGHFLREAVLSLERQTSKPDEIIVIDDASTDNSSEVLDECERRGYVVVRNEKNLGIVENFRKAVELTSSDYVFFLGADNRLRLDYVALCRAALDGDRQAAAAYTDVVLFGPLSGALAARIGGCPKIGRSASQNWDVYGWDFPDPTPEALESFGELNFVHGSSMYRRSFYDVVGGYRKTGGPEDHNLFYRMWEAGGKLLHIKQRILEYRQHSAAQANTALGLALENRALREHNKALIAENAQNKLLGTQQTELIGLQQTEILRLQQIEALAAGAQSADRSSQGWAERAAKRMRRSFRKRLPGRWRT